MSRLIIFQQGGNGGVVGLLLPLIIVIGICVVVMGLIKRFGKSPPVTHAEAAIDESRPPIVNRYQDAYRVGAALVGLGNTIKAVGVGLASIIVLISLRAGDGPFGMAGIFLAAIAGGLFWVCGVIVAAQGQILQATLDSAVASSHFLTDTERADAMGLPRSVANRSGA
jgi:hypothetical protein